MKTKIISIFIFLAFFCNVGGAVAQTANQGQVSHQKAEIINIKNVSGENEAPVGFSSKKITVKTASGEMVEVHEVGVPEAVGEQLHIGDSILLATNTGPDGEKYFYIADYDRSSQLAILFAVFVLVIALVGRWDGLKSLIGLGISFVVIVKVIVPQILTGTNPIAAALVGGFIIIPTTFYLSHGINKKTTIGVVGTFFSLILTGVLAVFFVNFTRITGFASDEAGLLQIYTNGTVNMRDLVLGGIIIASMGILDDITISQTSVVERLRGANKSYNARKLYNEAMIVGRDHIASLVNTLVLVYAGASLPLFILFVNQNIGLAPALSNEIITTEIVRTLVSSIGIVLAVPITSAIAAWQYGKIKDL